MFLRSAYEKGQKSLRYILEKGNSHPGLIASELRKELAIPMNERDVRLIAYRNLSYPGKHPHHVMPEPACKKLVAWIAARKAEIEAEFAQGKRTPAAYVPPEPDAGGNIHGYDRQQILKMTRNNLLMVSTGGRTTTPEALSKVVAEKTSLRWSAWQLDNFIQSSDDTLPNKGWMPDAQVLELFSLSKDLRNVIETNPGTGPRPEIGHVYPVAGQAESKQQMEQRGHIDAVCGHLSFLRKADAKTYTYPALAKYLSEKAGVELSGGQIRGWVSARVLAPGLDRVSVRQAERISEVAGELRQKVEADIAAAAGRVQFEFTLTAAQAQIIRTHPDLAEDLRKAAQAVIEEKLGTAGEITPPQRA